MAKTTGAKTTGAESATHGRVAKDERLAVRMPSSVKRILEQAASISGSSLSNFVINSAFRAAQETIEEMGRLRLAEEDSVAFLEALDNPPRPNDALTAAAARHKKHFG